MKKLLLSLTLLAGFALALKAGDTGTSFEQLLSRIAPAGAPVAAPAPATAKAVLPALQPDGYYWVTVQAADKYARTRLLEAGMDIVEIHKDKVSGFAHANTLKLLSVNKAMLVESVIPVMDYLSAVNKDFPAADAAYHNYAETTSLLKDMASKNPDIASVFSIGKTTEGRDIWCLRINSSAKGAAVKSEKPGAFFLGNVHAREHLADEVPLLFAAWLMDHRKDADIKKYIDTLDIYIVPMGNPDGVEYDIKTGKYQSHRKNTRINPDKSVGVDLNRNFDSWWCQQGASHSAWADTYCGPSAFSEPESKALKAFMEARKNLKTHISYHSYASEILYPWGGSDEDVPDQKDKAAFIKLAGEMGKLTGYAPIKSSEMYIATGDSCDWAYAEGKILAFTFELEGGSFYPGASIITKTVNSNIKAAVYLLSMTADPYK
ncbi:MAG: M14 family metallopeptidase [Elusimicrobia bacterium]|nr:M14 family metallopeptidase [Elusimicrobiota bacterium]